MIKLISIFLILILVPAVYAADMELAGAATSSVNGTYIETGTTDGVPYYVHQSNGIYLHRISGSFWVTSDYYPCGNPPDIYYYVNNSASTPDGLTLNTAGGKGSSASYPTVSEATLDIELNSFVANYKNNAVLLHWQTEMESNTAGFFIERSTDKQNWERIADCQHNNELVAQGMFNAQPEYAFVDESVRAGECYYYRLGEISTTGATKIYASTFVETPAVPHTTELTKIYPNPFNPQTTIHYQLASATHVKVDIYDLLGRKVRTLVDDMKSAGSHSLMWDGLNDQGETVATGIYHVHFQSDDQKQIRQISFLK